ncbi:Aldo/keto reductase [Catalinimonas alkaloidigena]|uniref:Aldo/keto reductase n=1 Tax=Catalinimonas alkaloidigena TaxID=1075417 RepID=A0A1G9RAB4_9BACT|nr:aldo/keto reductase [Catalinimonas alkaloidigena]SDM20081.1 Aldo/keto reductase [Catalinimonas alkaloidigena]
MTPRFSRRKALQLMGGLSLGAWTAPVALRAFAATPPGSFEVEATMNTRLIPSSGERLPVVGLGSWIQFDVGTAEAERQPLREVLQRMVDQGGTVIDSSPMYGKSEAVIGDLTTELGRADRFFYATKVWTTGQQAGIAQMEESFRKMQRQTMDLMQIHNLVDWQTHLKTLRDWKAAGKIRYLGITHYTTSAFPQLERILTSESIDFVQLPYSIRVRAAEQRLLSAAKDRGVAVLVNEPYESGSLFRAVKGKPLPDWAGDYDIASWGQFFLKFILSHPAVTCVIPGTSDPAHLVDNMGAGYGTLPDEAGHHRMAAYVAKL